MDQVTIELPADQEDALLAADGVARLAVEAICQTCRQAKCDTWPCRMSNLVPPAWCVGKCETCGGRGHTWRSFEWGYQPTYQVDCPTCDGSGLRRVEIGGHTFEVVEVLPVVTEHDDLKPSRRVEVTDQGLILLFTFSGDYPLDHRIAPIGTPTPGHYVVALRKVASELTAAKALTDIVEFEMDAERAAERVGRLFGIAEDDTVADVRRRLLWGSPAWRPPMPEPRKRPLVPIQPLQEAVWERITQRVRYFPWWVVHPIQYHRSESFRRAVEMIAREFVDVGESGIWVCSEVADDAGYSMKVTFERLGARDA